MGPAGFSCRPLALCGGPPRAGRHAGVGGDRLPEWDTLTVQWRACLAGPNRDGIYWLDGPIETPSLGSCLAFVRIKRKYPADAGLYAVVHQIFGQVGNLLESMVPQLAPTDPALLPAVPGTRADKALIGFWVERTLANQQGSRAALPALLRAVNRAAATAAADRIYKDQGSRCGCRVMLMWCRLLS